MVGMGTPIQTLPMSASHLKEVDIIGIFRYANTYPTGIKLISAGVLPDLDNMITHRVRLSSLYVRRILTSPPVQRPRIRQGSVRARRQDARRGREPCPQGACRDVDRISKRTHDVRILYICFPFFLHEP
jgi:hypothetical protein